MGRTNKSKQAHDRYAKPAVQPPQVAIATIFGASAHSVRPHSYSYHAGLCKSERGCYGPICSDKDAVNGVRDQTNRPKQISGRQIWIPERFFDEIDEHIAVAASCRASLIAPFDAMLSAWAESIRAGGKILFFGNGGSAGDAQHLATELTIRYRRDRAPIAAIALTTDTSALTAAGNDLGFDKIFARQIAALGKPGDIAMGISTSGRSPNVIEGLKQARTNKLVACALGGGDGGLLPSVADPVLIVPSKVTARIQEMHITLGQMLCGALEIELGLL